MKVSERAQTPPPQTKAVEKAQVQKPPVQKAQAPEPKPAAPAHLGKNLDIKG